MNCRVQDVIEKSFNSEFQYPISELDGYVSRQTNSWTICHEKFKEAKDEKSPDYDLLALHLGFYLASWGMYRGSSFLRELDYKIHYHAVKMMLEKRYSKLFDIDPLTTPERYRELLFDPKKGIYVRLNTYYGKAHDAWPKNTSPGRESVTDTLISKILMGVYGCIPAYDVNFKAGIACFKGQQALNPDGKAIVAYDKNGAFSKASLLYVLQNEKLRQDLETYANEHKIPFMKAVDMYFFGLGFECILEDARLKKAGKASTARDDIQEELEKLGYYKESNQ